jgi:hypothetical protein
MQVVLVVVAVQAAANLLLIQAAVAVAVQAERNVVKRLPVELQTQVVAVVAQVIIALTVRLVVQGV